MNGAVMATNWRSAVVVDAGAVSVEVSVEVAVVVAGEVSGDVDTSSDMRWKQALDAPLQLVEKRNTRTTGS